MVPLYAKTGKMSVVGNENRGVRLEISRPDRINEAGGETWGILAAWGQVRV